MPEERERWGGRLPFVMAAAGTVLLLGGFFTCLRIAMKGGTRAARAGE